MFPTLTLNQFYRITHITYVFDQDLFPGMLYPQPAQPQFTPVKLNEVKPILLGHRILDIAPGHF